mgnify:CR=1 FL=1
MRKSIIALASVGTVFAITAAGASSLTVTSGAVPAGGSVTATNCTASAAVAYTADVSMPGNVATVDITPTISGTGCSSLPALIKVSWTKADTTTVTAWAYKSAGLTASTTQSLASANLFSTAALAIAAGTADVTLPTVDDFGAPTIGITIAAGFTQ